MRLGFLLLIVFFGACSCIAASERQTTFLRNKATTTGTTDPIEIISKEENENENARVLKRGNKGGKGGKGSGSGGSNRCKNDKSKKVKRGKGKGSNKSSKEPGSSSKGKGKGSSRVPKSSKLPRSSTKGPSSKGGKGGKGKSNKDNNDCVECFSAEAREPDIIEVVESLSGDIFSLTETQRRALDWLLDTDLDTNACDGDTRIVQRYALANFYFSTAGPYQESRLWLNPKVGECEWEGITCDSDGEVIEIKLGKFLSFFFF